MLQPGLEARPTVVAVTEVPLKEIESEADLPEALAALIDHDLPAVLVRQAGLDGEQLDHFEMTDIAVEGLKVIGYRPGQRVHPIPVAGHDRAQIGRLHFDGPNGKVFPPDINIHTTTQGAGKAWFANAGTGTTVNYRGAPHNLLLEGKTNPRHMQSLIHVAELATGDSVIFAPANMCGPVWHRFDTSVGPRRVALTELSDLTSLYET